jgi:hypothetical protein
VISWRNHPHAAAAAAAQQQQRGITSTTGQHQQHQHVPWVATGKHLCGAATDFALRACYNAITLRLPPGSKPSSCSSDNSELQECQQQAAAAVEQPAGSSSSSLDAVMQPEQYPLQGLAVATCCHHRCGWAAFVGKQQLAEHELGSREDFETIAWCTSECFCQCTCVMFTYACSCCCLLDAVNLASSCPSSSCFCWS